jgi:hypothetical protein
VTWGCAGDPVCDVPWIVFTQNAIDLLNHFHQTIPILFELDLLAKAFQTFIIATRHGSPRDFSSRRGRNTQGSDFGVSFQGQVGIRGRDCRLLPQPFVNLFQRNLFEMQFSPFFFFKSPLLDKPNRLGLIRVTSLSAR